MRWMTHSPKPRDNSAQAVGLQGQAYLSRRAPAREHLRAPAGVESRARKLVHFIPCSLLLVCATPPTAAAMGPVDASYAPSLQAQGICRAIADAGHWPIEGTASADCALASLDNWAQRHLKRPAGQERMEPASLEHYKRLYNLLTPAQRKQVVTLFAAMGDAGPRGPARRQYAYILIHGTTVQGMRARVMSVAQAVKRGQLEITPQTRIVILDGERALFASEPDRVLLDTSPYPTRAAWHRPDVLPTEEREAAELIWDQLDLPDVMRRASPVFIHAAKKPEARRAETEDTVAAWSQQDPSVHGTALMVSENPVIEYQRFVTQALLYRNGVRALHLDAMGPDVRLKDEPEPVRIGYMLDNLAACLHWANKMRLEAVPLR